MHGVFQFDAEGRVQASQSTQLNSMELSQHVAMLD
jgi:hypothetical protein